MKEPSTQEVLQAVRKHHKGGPYPDDALADKYSKEAILRKMQQLVNAGVLWYDGDIRGAMVVGEDNG